MNNFKSIFLAILVLVFLTACGESSSPESSSTPADNTNDNKTPKNPLSSFANESLIKSSGFKPGDYTKISGMMIEKLTSGSVLTLLGEKTTGNETEGFIIGFDLSSLNLSKQTKDASADGLAAYTELAVDDSTDTVFVLDGNNLAYIDETGDVKSVDLTALPYVSVKINLPNTYTYNDYKIHGNAFYVSTKIDNSLVPQFLKINLPLTDLTADLANAVNYKFTTSFGDRWSTLAPLETFAITGGADPRIVGMTTCAPVGSMSLKTFMEKGSAKNGIDLTADTSLPMVANLANDRLKNFASVVTSKSFIFKVDESSDFFAVSTSEGIQLIGRDVYSGKGIVDKGISKGDGVFFYQKERNPNDPNNKSEGQGSTPTIAPKNEYQLLVDVPSPGVSKKVDAYKGTRIIYILDGKLVITAPISSK